MRTRWLTLFVLAAIVLCLVGSPPPTVAAPTGAPATPDVAVPGDCVEGEPLAGGAQVLICVPSSGWTGDVVYWAHGYVPEGLPLDFYNTTLPDGTYLPTLVQSLGFAFATTSYRTNGLAVVEGVADMGLLVERFEQEHPPSATSRAYITGASEGGLITALLAEQSPQRFDGALAACGIVDSFRRQVNSWGDFRVLFDYFFPGVLPGSAVAIPPALMLNWETTYAPSVAGALSADPSRLRQLMATAKVPYNAADLSTAITASLSVLWYHTFATNNARAQLGGNPFDNRGRWYWGSKNDLLLNLRVQRFRADSAALAAIDSGYETKGRPNIPVVLPHTTGDEVVRFDQTLLYWLTARPQGAGSVLPIAIDRYGHCTFTSGELLLSFGLLLQQTGGLSQAQQAVLDGAGLDTAAAQATLERALAAFHAAEAEDAAHQRSDIKAVIHLPLLTR